MYPTFSSKPLYHALNRSVKHMANNNCTQKGRGLSSPFVILRAIPNSHCIATAYSAYPFRRYTAGRGQPALRKRSGRKAVRSSKRQDGSSCPTETPPKKVVRSPKNNQINRQHTKGTPDSVPFSFCPTRKRTENTIPVPPFGEAEAGQVCRSRPHRLPIKVRACT